MYQATAEILLGLSAEKSEKNVEKARGHYIRALRRKAYERRYTQDLYAMAYAGLARMAAAEGNREGARTHYKKALELAGYESTIREARHYLKND